MKYYSRNYFWILIAVILIVISYFPVFNAGFVNWDDDYFVTSNPLIQAFSFQNMKAWFTQPFLGLYQPFVLLSFALDYKIDGLNPLIFHTTNLLLHLLNTLLVYFFVKKLFANKTIAIITMLLFGLHSIHVESVAWVTERKDLLYSLFYLTALNFYLEFIAKQKNKFYLLVALAFVFSLLSKAMAVSFPFILLLIDFYKQRDLLNKKVILEKIPFFLIAAVWGLLTLYWHNQHGSLDNSTGFTIAERIILGAKGLGFYISHIVVPLNLAAFHPLPSKLTSAIMLECLFYILLLVAVLIWVFIKRKKYRIVFFGFGFFIFTIFLILIPPGVPVIASERYAYIGSLGIFILISHGFYFLQTKFIRYKIPLQILLAVYLIFLGINTFQMTRTWDNSLALWNRAINVHGEIFYPLQQRGIANRLDKNYPKAIEDFNAAIQLNSNNYRSYEQRGYVYSLMGNYGKAELDFKKALELNPKSHIAWANLGFIYRNTSEQLKALDCFDKAIAIKKDYVDAYINRAKLNFELDKAPSACADLNYANSLFRTKSQSLEIDQLIKEYNCIRLESRILPGWQAGKSQESRILPGRQAGKSQEPRTKNPAWLAGKSQELRTKN